LTGADPYILSFDTVDSTNSEAARRIQAGLIHHPLWIVTKTQKSGRGRLGRQWVSDEGNVFASLAWPAPELSIAPQLSFLIAVAAQQLLQGLVKDKAEVTCKWPNDILMDGQKISGILLETAKTPKGEDWVIIGIGINLTSKPEESRWPATCLAETMEPPHPQDIIKRLHRNWTSLFQIWEDQGFTPLAKKWVQCAFGLGHEVRYSVKNKMIVGSFTGLDETGAALIRLDSGWVERIYAGEIEFSQGVGD